MASVLGGTPLRLRTFCICEPGSSGGNGFAPPYHERVRLYLTYDLKIREILKL